MHRSEIPVSAVVSTCRNHFLLLIRSLYYSNARTVLSSWRTQIRSQLKTRIG